FDFVEVDIASEGAAGQFAAQFGPLALGGQQVIVARVVDQRGAHFRDQPAAGFAGDLVRDVGRDVGQDDWQLAVVSDRDRAVQVGIEFDVDIFDGVTEAAAQQLGAQRLDQSQTHAGGLFAVGVVPAEKVQFMMVKFGVELKFALEKPRLDK